MIYALCKRSYDTWHPKGVKYIFATTTEAPTEAEYHAVQQKLIDVFAETTAEDLFIPGGPHWMVLLSGYLWCTRDCTDRFNTLILDKSNRKLAELRGPIAN